MKVLTVNIQAKCNDMCSVGLRTESGQVFCSHGYVPEMGIGGGDYIDLEINVQTGQILNWKPLDTDSIEDFERQFKQVN